MKKKCGIYIVGQGVDFTLKSEVKNPQIGYCRTLEPLDYYVVNGKTGAIMGRYSTEHLAINLAKGLNKRDKECLNKEIENILSSNE